MRSNVLLFLCNHRDDRSSTYENPFLLPATILTATMKGRWIKGRDCRTLNPTRCKGWGVCARMEILSENSANTVNGTRTYLLPSTAWSRTRGTRCCVFVPGPPPYVSKQSSRRQVTRFVSTSGDTRKPQTRWISVRKIICYDILYSNPFSSPPCFRPLRPYRYTSSISVLCTFPPSDFRLKRLSSLGFPTLSLV